MIRRAAACIAAIALSACVTVPRDNGFAPSPPDLPAAARDNTALGAGYLREGRIDLALAKLRRAIEQDPDYAAAHSTLALVYAQRGDNEKAEREYRRALELGDDPDVRNNFGVFLCGAGKSAEADRYFLEAARNREYSTPEAAWSNAGVCARKAGDSKRAAADFREALRINPEFTDALAPLAAMSFAERDYTQARALLQRYERLAPPSAALLALGAKTERALGHPDAAQSYELKLQGSFPDSEEAAQLARRTAVP